MRTVEWRGRRVATLVLAAVGALALAACGDDGGGSTPTDPGGGGADPVSTDWHHTMTDVELREVLAALDIDASPDADHDELVAMLEEATGCGCFGAVCGTGYCGHDCGGCETAGTNPADFSCFSGSCEAAYTCDEAAMSVATTDGLVKDNGETIQFRFDGEVPSDDFDVVRVASNTVLGEALQPGTYDLRLFDPTACALCVRAYKGCPDGTVGGDCASTYVATAGSVTIDTAIGGASFTASLSGLKFEPSYEDPKTGNVFVLPAGQPKCVADVAMTGTVEQVIIEPTDCDPLGTGSTIGSNIKDYTAINCLGEEVRLHSACGQKAVWVVAAAGW